jgi:hypothetical protein
MRLPQGIDGIYDAPDDTGVTAWSLSCTCKKEKGGFEQKATKGTKNA